MAQTIHVDTTPARAIKFDPDRALGSSVDILQASQMDTVYSEPILKDHGDAYVQDCKMKP